MERAKLKAKKLRLTFDQWLVKLVFGREGGMVERVNNAYRVDHLDATVIHRQPVSKTESSPKGLRL